MDLGLAGRVYVMTGASRGLGFAAAQCLVEDGAHVVISARDPSRVREAAHALAATGPGSATGIALDNTDHTAGGQLIGEALARYGRLDGGLISVGGPPGGTAAGVTDEQWRESFETVFLGALRLARTLAHRLAGRGGTGNSGVTGDDRAAASGTASGAKTSGTASGAKTSGTASGAKTSGTASGAKTSGAIGFVLSSSVRAPIAGLGISNGLRPGLAGVAKDMADEYGRHGVRVFSLLPGSIDTDRIRELYGASADPDAARRAAENGTALKRIGDPEEFGRVAAFALSPAASYLTGLTIAVDGGAIRTI